MVAALLFLAVTGVMAWSAYLVNDRHFVYALDDPYIHLSMARSFARAGVWGVTPHAFTSSTSSPLWTLILATAFFVLGSRDLIPFALNLVIGVVVLAAAHRVLLRRSVEAGWRLAALVGLWAGAALPFLVMTGMEHVLQILFVVLFLGLALDALSGDAEAGRRARPAMAAVASLMCVTRYEGLFLVAAFVLLCALRRRWRDALVVAAASVTLVAAYGAWSVSHGWYWLPTSVLVKSEVDISHVRFDAVSRLMRAVARLTQNEHVLAMVAVSTAALALRVYRRRWDPATALHAMFLVTAALHLTLVQLFWQFPHDRYQAYLAAMFVLALAATSIQTEEQRQEAMDPLLRVGFVGLGVVCVLLLTLEGRSCAFMFFPGRFLRYLVMAATPVLLLLLLALRRPKGLTPSVRLAALRVGALGAVLVALCPLYVWSLLGLKMIPSTCGNIYQQQYQMARFVRERYPAAVVAANDIGAITYLGRARCVDVIGLADLEVARKRCRHELSMEYFRRLARERGVKIAILYDGWFQRQIPPEWKRVAVWHIDDNIVCAFPNVSFYAVAPGERERLAGAIRAFSRELPSEVAVEGEYQQVASSH